MSRTNSSLKKHTRRVSMDSASLTKGINARPASSTFKCKGTEVSTNDTSPSKPLRPVSSTCKYKGTEVSTNDTSLPKPLHRHDTVVPTSINRPRRQSIDRNWGPRSSFRQAMDRSYIDSAPIKTVNGSVTSPKSPHDITRIHQTKGHEVSVSNFPSSSYNTPTLADRPAETLRQRLPQKTGSIINPREPYDFKEMEDYQENFHEPSYLATSGYYYPTKHLITSALKTQEADGRAQLLAERLRPKAFTLLPLLDKQPMKQNPDPFKSLVHEERREITPITKEKHPSALVSDTHKLYGEYIFPTTDAPSSTKPHHLFEEGQIHKGNSQRTPPKEKHPFALASDTQKLFGGYVSPITDAAGLINAQLPKRPQPSTSVSPTVPVPAAKRGFNPDICQVPQGGLFETNTARLASPKKPTNCRNSQPSAPIYPDSNAEINTPYILRNNRRIKRISTPNLPSYKTNQEIAIPKIRRRASVTQVTPNHPIIIDQEKPAPQIPKAKKKSTKSRAKKVLTNLYYNNGFLKYSIYYELDSNGEKSYYYQPFFSKKIYCIITSEHEVRLR